MRRRSIASVLVLCAALVGCSGGTPTTTLRLQVSGEPEETAWIRSLARAYERDHPEVRVEVVEVLKKRDHLAKLATAFAAGSPPDLFVLNYREYAQFVPRGALDPVGPRLDALGLDRSRYFDAPLDAFTFGGALQCMPTNASSLVVYVNIDVFAAKREPLPAAGWTWDDFSDAARALTGDGVRGLGVEPLLPRLAPFVWSNGGELVDDDSAPSRFTLDTPEARQALTFVTGLARDGYVPTEEELAAQGLEERFIAGRLGMFLGSRADTPVFREAKDLAFDVAPLPRAKSAVSILHSDGFCLAKGSDHAAEAAAFVAEAAGSLGMSIGALAGRIVPSLREAAEGVFLDPTQPPASAQVWLDAIPTLRRTPVLPTWPEIEDLAEEAITKAFYAPGYSVDDLVREIDQRAGPLLTEGTER